MKVLLSDRKLSSAWWTQLKRGVMVSWLQSCVSAFAYLCHHGFVPETFLWVKHLLFLLLCTFAINVVMVHVLFHCFVLSINCCLNPRSLLLSFPFSEGMVGGKGRGLPGFNFQLGKGIGKTIHSEENWRWWTERDFTIISNKKNYMVVSENVRNLSQKDMLDTSMCSQAVEL